MKKTMVRVAVVAALALTVAVGTDLLGGLGIGKKGDGVMAKYRGIRKELTMRLIEAIERGDTYAINDCTMNLQKNKLLELVERVIDPNDDAYSYHIAQILTKGGHEGRGFVTKEDAIPDLNEIDVLREYETNRAFRERFDALMSKYNEYEGYMNVHIRTRQWYKLREALYGAPPEDAGTGRVIWGIGKAVLAVLAVGAFAVAVFLDIRTWD